MALTIDCEGLGEVDKHYTPHRDPCSALYTFLQLANGKDYVTGTPACMQTTLGSRDNILSYIADESVEDDSR